VNVLKPFNAVARPGADILILARTDARDGLGLDEALERIRLFADAGADIGTRGPAKGQNVG